MDKNNLLNTSKSGNKEMLIIFCDYEEFEPETYKGIDVNTFTGNSNQIDKFSSGNFLKDLDDSLSKYKEHKIIFSSSIDNYLMDTNINHDDLKNLYKKHGIY